MSKKVLVVDDSFLQHRMYAIALRAYPGDQVDAHFAGSGPQALETLRHHPDTDLIVLDVNMPGMGGLEVLQRVQEETTLRHIPVVLQSTDDHLPDIESGLEAGAVGYLIKPFMPPALHEMMDSVFCDPGSTT